MPERQVHPIFQPPYEYNDGVQIYRYPEPRQLIGANSMSRNIAVIGFQKSVALLREHCIQGTEFSKDGTEQRTNA